MYIDKQEIADKRKWNNYRNIKYTGEGDLIHITPGIRHVHCSVHMQYF